MSVVIEFKQIEVENIISENKIFGLYEVFLEEIEWKKGCYFDTDIFQELNDDANKWTEIYFQPNTSKFLFYLLAVDTEMNVGIRNVDGKDIIAAFDPNVINEFVKSAKNYTSYGKQGGFDKLSEIVEESIHNNYLIVTRIN